MRKWRGCSGQASRAMGATASFRARGQLRAPAPSATPSNPGTRRCPHPTGEAATWLGPSPGAGAGLASPGIRALGRAGGGAGAWPAAGAGEVTVPHGGACWDPARSTGQHPPHQSWVSPVSSNASRNSCRIAQLGLSTIPAGSEWPSSFGRSISSSSILLGAWRPTAGAAGTRGGSPGANQPGGTPTPAGRGLVPSPGGFLRPVPHRQHAHGHCFPPRVNPPRLGVPLGWGPCSQHMELLRNGTRWLCARSTKTPGNAPKPPGRHRSTAPGADSHPPPPTTVTRAHQAPCGLQQDTAP